MGNCTSIDSTLKIKYDKNAFSRNKSAIGNAQRFCYENRLYLNLIKSAQEQKKSSSNVKYIQRIREIMEGKNQHSSSQQKVIDCIAKDEVYKEIIMQVQKYDYETQKELLSILQDMLLKDQNKSFENFFLKHLDLLEFCIQSHSNEQIAKIFAPLVQELIKSNKIHEKICQKKFVELLCEQSYIKNKSFIVMSESMQTFISILSQFQFESLQQFLNQNKEFILEKLDELMNLGQYFITRKVLEYLSTVVEQNEELGMYYTGSEDNFKKVMNFLKDKESVQLRYVSFKLFYQFLLKLQTRDVEVIRKIVVKNKGNLEKLIKTFQFDEENEEQKEMIPIKETVFNLLQKMENEERARKNKAQENVH